MTKHNINELSFDEFYKLAHKKGYPGDFARYRLIGTRSDRSCTLTVLFGKHRQLLEVAILYHQEGRRTQQVGLNNLEEAYEKLQDYLNNSK